MCIDISQSYFSRIQKLIGDENDNVNVDADNVPSATQVTQINSNLKKHLKSYLIFESSSKEKILKRLVY